MTRYLFSLPLLLLLIPMSAGATAVIAIRSPAALTIAADSLLTIKQSPTAVLTGSECKIRNTGEVFYALAGLSRDPAREFDVWKLVEKGLVTGGGLAVASERVAAAVREGLATVLQRLRREAPELYAASLGGRNDHLVRLMLAAVEDGTPKLIVFGFRQQAQSGKEPAIIEPVITVERRSCPGDCKADGVSLFLLGDHQAMDSYLKRERVNWQEPEATARLLVEEEIRAGTPGVGGPVDLLRLDRDGATWLARKAICGGSGEPAGETDGDGGRCRRRLSGTLLPPHPDPLPGGEGML